jgi:hypothetical protein
MPTSTLGHAPTGWLRGFLAGSVLLTLGAAGAVAQRLAGTMLAQAGVGEWVDAGRMTAAVLWWLGVLVVTRPRPGLPSTQTDPREEWFWGRLIARVTQAGWVVQLGLGVAAARATAALGSAPWWLEAVTIAAGLVAAGGLAVLLVYLSNLCFWAQDTRLAELHRGAAWLVVAGAGMGALAAADAAVGLIGGFIGSMAGLAAMAVTLAAAACTLRCLWWTQATAVWALRNHAGAEARVREMRAEAVVVERRSVSGEPGAGPRRPTAHRPPPAS